MATSEKKDEVVLIEDDDEPIAAKTNTQVKNITTSKDIVDLDADDDFSETLKRFLEYGCSIIDLVECDKDQEKRKMTSKCMNSYCQSGVNLSVAPDFVKSHYGLPDSKNQLICNKCFLDARNHFKEMTEMLKNREPIFDKTFPKINPVVLIDSDDEEEMLDEDEELPEEVIEMISENLDDCLEEFMDAHDMKYQVDQAVERIREKVTLLEKGIHDNAVETTLIEKDLLNTMKGLYKTYLGQAVLSEEVNIPFEEMRPFMLSNKNGVGKDFDSENEVIMMASFDKIPLVSNLPPEGEITRPKPKVGDKLYVMKVTTFSEWVPAVVDEIVQKTVEGKLVDHFKVKINGGKSNYQKEVVAGHMAYWSPPPVRLPVGTRVITLATTHRHPRKFFSGITAEHPSNVNGCRYLVFFDDGYSQYAHHENIRLVCESKTNVAEYFNPNSQDFIRQYLDLFPERLMLKVKKLDTIKTEFTGLWYNARVKNVDGALVQMLFLKDFHSEWIYRGSTRLFPVYEEAARVKRDASGFSRYRGTTVRRHPFIYSDFAVTPERNEIEAMESISTPSVQPRAVARKSTSRDTELRSQPNWTRSVAKLDYGKVEAEFPNALKPLTFRPHKCNSSCISWTNYVPDKALGVNPLILPIMFGFRRLEKNSNRLILSGDAEHTIAYDAPCGRKLRTYEEVFIYLKQTSSKLTVDLFDFDYWVHIYDEYKVPGKFVILSDLSYGEEQVPIPCVNSVDNSVPPYMFYMIKRRGKEGVYLNLDPGFLTCCDCTNDCEDREKCACWQKTIQGVKTITKHGPVMPYTVGYQYRRLQDVVRTGIYECNQRCKCRSSCLNRVVQLPLKLKLQLFKTKKKGWGTRCINDIPAGTFVCVYVGDILTEAYANEGGKRFGDEYFAELDYIESVEALKEDYEEDVVRGPSEDEMEFEKTISYANGGESDDEFEPYIFQQQEKDTSRMQLRKRKSKNGRKSIEGDFVSEDESSSSDDTRQPRMPSHFDVPIVSKPQIIKEMKPASVRTYYGKDESVYIMDAKTAGNIGRYLNHSCDPNLFVQNVFVDTHDLRFPWVAFFALRHIKAGSELTWDYRYEVGSVAGKKLYCYCESAECRGRLL